MKLIVGLFVLSMATLPVCARQPKPLKPYLWEKGNIHLDLSTFPISHFDFRPPNTATDRAGILGIGLGADYCYRHNRFISLQGGAATSLLPVERFYDSTGHIHAETMNAVFLNVRDNYAWWRLTLGYGLAISRHSWIQRDSYRDVLSIPEHDSVVRHGYTNVALGGSFAAHYMLSRFFYMGVLYQPQVLSIQNNVQWKYEHFIALDLLFRFNVYNRSRHIPATNIISGSQ